MTAAINLNENLGTNLLSFPNFDGSKLPLAFIKYQRIERVINDIPNSIQDIVVDMLNLFEPTKAEKKVKILIDYKVRDLKRGDTGCPIPGWHTDYTENPNNDQSLEEHLIFTTHIGTEFITTPMEVTPFDDHYSEVLARNPIYDFVGVAPNTVTRYNRLNLHRCPIMVEDCRRVVIRLTKILLTSKED